MGAPNPDDPLANDVAEHWKTDEKSAIDKGKRSDKWFLFVLIFPFFILAAEWTKLYAKAE